MAIIDPAKLLAALGKTMKFSALVVSAFVMGMGLTGVSLGQHYDAYGAAIAQSVPPNKTVRSMIAQAARNWLVDPYSVRDAAISNIADFGGTQGLCVMANSKNRMGGYIGRQSYAITLAGTVLVSAEINHPLCARPDIQWHTFPELEALRDL